MIITKLDDLTPVQCVDGLLLKRDDLYKPFGDKTVNGGKLRQCMALVGSIHEHYNGLITCCSIYSPQGPITAATGKYFNMPTIVCYGGTTDERLRRYPMPIIAANYKAKNVVLSKSGIHKILYYKATEIAEKLNYFIVDYGFNITKYPDLLLKSISRQVENLPDELDNLVVTCGSGITTIGILIGLKMYDKRVKSIYLVCTAPNRRELIDSTLKSIGIEAHYNMIDLFHQPSFRYEDGLKRNIGEIQLHPQYEAKSYDWLKNNIDQSEKTLLWIVGSKPSC